MSEFHLDLSREGIYTYFIDNQRTASHGSVIFGVRELNSTELNQFCSNGSKNELPIPSQPFLFSSNYELRGYISVCYYLDANNCWQCDGLLVYISFFCPARRLGVSFLSARTVDESSSNTMLFHSSDHFYHRISVFI